MKAEAIAEAEDLTELDLTDKVNHKCNEEIQIGYECKVFLQEKKDKLMISLEDFYSNIKNFYISSAKYMIANYPFKDELLINAKVVDIRERKTAKFSSVEYFVHRFSLLPPKSMDSLESEFNMY